MNLKLKFFVYILIYVCEGIFVWSHKHEQILMIENDLSYFSPVGYILSFLSGTSSKGYPCILIYKSYFILIDAISFIVWYALCVIVCKQFMILFEKYILPLEEAKKSLMNEKSK